MVQSIIDLLNDLLPVWLLLVLLGFGYLIYLFREASNRFISLAERQSEYFKDRFEVVDTATGVFERAIEQQEKEIQQLSRRLSEEREQDAERGQEELEVVASALGTIAEVQEHTVRMLEERTQAEGVIDTEQVNQLLNTLRSNLNRQIPDAIRRQNLSAYPIKVNHLPRAEEFVGRLSEIGFRASLYEEDSIIGEEPEPQPPADPEGHAAIWVGSRVPPDLVVEVLYLARQEWTHLRYVHLSNDGTSPPDYVHDEIFIGGATRSAVQFYECEAWDEEDFNRLSPDMGLDELHSYIRSFYPIK